MAFDRGWQAGIEYVSNPFFGAHTMASIDRHVIEVCAARAEANARLRRLDEAERQGPEAYDAERARQGLIRYSRTHNSTSQSERAA